MKITYQDKISVRQAGPPVNSWIDDDANEVKTVVNNNFDLIDGRRITGVVTFTRLTTWVGSPFSPHTGGITIDTTGGVDGAVACVYYKGPALSRASFTGATIQIYSGENTVDELCLVWIVYDKNAPCVHVNIQVDTTGGQPTPGVPSATAPTITVTEVGEPIATAPTITVT